MQQLTFDLTATINEAELKTLISAHHRRLGYGSEGPHLRHSLWVHLKVRSVSSCKDMGKLVVYEAYLSRKVK